MVNLGCIYGSLTSNFYCRFCPVWPGCPDSSSAAVAGLVVPCMTRALLQVWLALLWPPLKLWLNFSREVTLRSPGLPMVSCLPRVMSCHIAIELLIICGAFLVLEYVFHYVVYMVHNIWCLQFCLIQRCTSATLASSKKMQYCRLSECCRF
jgi:hypothetical protein